MLSQYLANLAHERPHDVAFTYKDKQNKADSLTYSELHEAALRIGKSIADRTTDNQIVFIAMRQSIDFLKILYGTIYSGRVFLPTYPIRNSHDIARLNTIIKTVQPAFIVVDELAPLDQIKEENGSSTITLKDLWAGDKLKHPIPNNDLIFLQCSSGTTRSPKAIEVTSTSLLNCLENMKNHFQATSQDIGCSWLPPYHDMGLIGGIFLPVYAGFTTHLMSSSGFMMNPLSWLEQLSATKATITAAPNIAYDLCVRRAEKKHLDLDLSSVRIMINSAQMIHPQTINSFNNTFLTYGLNPGTLRTAYGLAEATLMVTCTPLSETPKLCCFSRSGIHKGIALESKIENDDQVAIISSGQPIQGMEIIIVDRESSRPLPNYHIGEIWISGNSLTRRYHDNPEATADIFCKTINGKMDCKEYIATGDTGFIDNEGNLFVTGRIKDSIKTDHGLVSAEEIEEIIETNDFQDPSYRCAALMISRHDHSEIIILRELEKDTDPMAHATQMDYLLRKKLMLRVNKILYMRRGTIPTTTSGKVKRHAAIVLYLHDLLEPYHIFEFEPKI